MNDLFAVHPRRRYTHRTCDVGCLATASIALTFATMCFIDACSVPVEQPQVAKHRAGVHRVQPNAQSLRNQLAQAGPEPTPVRVTTY